MSHQYKLFDGFTVVAESPAEFVQAMKDSAIFLARSKTVPEYMRGVSARLTQMHAINGNLGGTYFVRSPRVDSSDEIAFVESLCRFDLLTISSLD